MKKLSSNNAAFNKNNQNQPSQAPKGAKKELDGENQRNGEGGKGRLKGAGKQPHGHNSMYSANRLDTAPKPKVQ